MAELRWGAILPLLLPVLRSSDVSSVTIFFVYFKINKIPRIIPFLDKNFYQVFFCFPNDTTEEDKNMARRTCHRVIQPTFEDAVRGPPWRKHFHAREFPFICPYVL